MKKKVDLSAALRFADFINGWILKCHPSPCRSLASRGLPTELLSYRQKVKPPLFCRYHAIPALFFFPPSRLVLWSWLRFRTRPHSALIFFYQWTFISTLPPSQQPPSSVLPPRPSSQISRPPPPPPEPPCKLLGWPAARSGSTSVAKWTASPSGMTYTDVGIWNTSYSALWSPFTCLCVGQVLTHKWVKTKNKSGTSCGVGDRVRAGLSVQAAHVWGAFN